MDRTKIKTYMSSRNNVGIVVDNYKYRKDKILVSGDRSWRCVVKGCSARLNTNSSMSRIKNMTGHHTHEENTASQMESPTASALVVSTPLNSPTCEASPASDVSERNNEESCLDSSTAMWAVIDTLRDEVARLRVGLEAAATKACENCARVLHGTKIGTREIGTQTDSGDEDLSNLSGTKKAPNKPVSSPLVQSPKRTTAFMGAPRILADEEIWEDIQLYNSKEILVLQPAVCVQIRLSENDILEDLPGVHEDVKLVLAPISNASLSKQIENNKEGTHWSLVSIDLIKGEYYHLDSIPGLNESAAIDFGKKINKLFGFTPFVFKDKKCEVQQDSVSCGRYLIANIKEEVKLFKSGKTVQEPLRYISSTNNLPETKNRYELLAAESSAQTGAMSSSNGGSWQGKRKKRRRPNCRQHFMGIRGGEDDFRRTSQPKVPRRRLFVFSDSHGRGLQKRLSVNDDTDVFVYSCPGAPSSYILENSKDTVSRLTENDLAVIIAGANDMQGISPRNNKRSRVLPESIRRFVQHHGKHTNVVVSTFFHRHDLHPHSFINEEVHKNNDRLRRLSGDSGISILDTRGFGRRLFTRHGLHLNQSGKDQLCRQILKFLPGNVKRSRTGVQASGDGVIASVKSRGAGEVAAVVCGSELASAAVQRRSLAPDSGSMSVFPPLHPGVRSSSSGGDIAGSAGAPTGSSSGSPDGVSVPAECEVSPSGPCNSHNKSDFLGSLV